MADPDSIAERHFSAPSWLQGTAFRMFVVLSLALLPLVLVALVSTLRSMNAANAQQHQLLRAATEQSAGKLESDIVSIQTAQALIVRALDGSASLAETCGRLQSLIHGDDSRGVDLLVADRQGRILCPPRGPSKLQPRDVLNLSAGSDVIVLPDQRGVLVRTAGAQGEVVSGVLMEPDFLRRVMLPPDSSQARGFVLTQNERRLNVNATAQRGKDQQQTSAQSPVGRTGIVLTLSLNAPPPTIAQSLSLAAPLIMWAVAALLGWLVVRWALIQPLVTLQRAVANYRPGQIISPPHKMLNASYEIAELGRTFEIISAQVAAHEDEMRLALERQTKLTREVHHRVKNNLQIVASLISLHARAATDAQARDAYAAIQRRVDALAVVQRNHYAELDGNRGVSARPLITEIATSLRASARADGGPISIQVDSDPVYLHQDVAAPVAFMIAELADLAMQIDPASALKIALIRSADAPGKAMLHIQSDSFRGDILNDHDGAKLTDRILTGLSRQLREPLDHDPVTGEYCIRLNVS